jgi:hypothetical protein
MARQCETTRHEGWMVLNSWGKIQIYLEDLAPSAFPPTTRPLVLGLANGAVFTRIRVIRVKIQKYPSSKSIKREYCVFTSSRQRINQKKILLFRSFAILIDNTSNSSICTLISLIQRFDMDSCRYNPSSREI